MSGGIDFAPAWAALNAVGTTLSEAGALPAVIVPDQPPPTRQVDCGPCTACCHMAVFVGPWDNEEYDLQPGTTILARRPELSTRRGRALRHPLLPTRIIRKAPATL